MLQAPLPWQLLDVNDHLFVVGLMQCRAQDARNLAAALPSSAVHIRYVNGLETYDVMGLDVRTVIFFGMDVCVWLDYVLCAEKSDY